ncbi:hypothetical protein Lepto7376_0028 [[Leptolyngbya] sp. PCC 7376]|uniref:hypothetical protein n=1 Tax=[Leptolyngbya] sp. PCC 7376 TaxID=111781 RepID=UPI00029F4592|nr:hypothetical protein [[Leptolyngbya] sp. PCC 7376]AFY36488.1 hypothetical protein Lepto7376_0028 [[Leptolyngbya] sp. PCC 7376]
MNAFILHTSPLQARVWQKILQSQDWSASVLDQQNDLQKKVLVSEAENQAPDVILMSEGSANISVTNFCRWLVSRPTKIPLILLSKTPAQSKLILTNRQLAKAKGAYDLLPAFSADTIAIEAVKGLKCVAAATGEEKIQNSALMSCIVELKGEFTPPKMTAGTQTQTKAAKTKKVVRKFRGQEY